MACCAPELNGLFAILRSYLTSKCRKSFGGLGGIPHLNRIGLLEISKLGLARASIGELTVSVFYGLKSRR